MPVWLDNVIVVQLFLDMDRQLNMGFGGPVGFRYESLYPLLDRVCKDSEDEWWATFRDFQTMESAAMEEAHRK